MRRSTKTLTAAAAAMVLGAGLASAALAAGSDPPAETRSEARFTDAHRSDAAIGAATAEAAARAARPGRVFDTHLEDEGRGLRWEVKTDDGSQVWEVQVDAGSGAVVSVHPDE